MKQSQAMRWVVGALILICALCMGLFFVILASGLANAATSPFSGKVVGIADGDTLTVLADNVPHKIRLAEIDAPEKKQPFGERAKLSLSDLCFGQHAEVSPGKTDRYGRTVARVACEGIDASMHQVQAGLAWAYTQYLTDPAIAVAETLARDTCTGLWADAARVPPWSFRKAGKAKP